MTNAAAEDRAELSRLRDLSPTQWKSGLAAWLGWLFDGLDMHLYSVVALPFVALLMGVNQSDATVGRHASWIQAAFLVGWALGGGFYGRLGDRLGRCRALMLTIFTYAIFTGLSFFSQTWWQLLIFRFLAALGIGGEWAVGASLLSETWPVAWRHWIAATLQSAVCLGVLFASVACFVILRLANLPERSVFIVGVFPALLVLWIRSAVPEPDEWKSAKLNAAEQQPKFSELFSRSVRKTTILVIVVCAASLSGHWAFMFWFQQQLRRLPDVISWTDDQRSGLVSGALAWVMVMAIAGNFLAGWLAKVIGYRRAIALLCVAYFVSMICTYSVQRDHVSIWWWLMAPGLSQGVFALFTMYLPPLFPTLLRTTGAGFCYNIGRLAAAFGTVYFGRFDQAGDYRLALFYSGFLFLPAAVFALLLPELPRSQKIAESSA